MKKEMIRKSWPALALLQDGIWIIQNFNGKEIFHHFYDKKTDVRSSLHPKRTALAEEDLEPNLGQHWDHPGEYWDLLLYKKQRHLLVYL